MWIIKILFHYLKNYSAWFGTKIRTSFQSIFIIDDNFTHSNVDFRYNLAERFKSKNEIEKNLMINSVFEEKVWIIEIFVFFNIYDDSELLKISDLLWDIEK